MVYLKINGASNLNSNTHFCLIHGALWSLILALMIMEGWETAWLGTGAHSSRQHPDCDADSWGAAVTVVTGLLASTEMGPKGGRQLGIFKKGRESSRVPEFAKQYSSAGVNTVSKTGD